MQTTGEFMKSNAWLFLYWWVVGELNECIGQYGAVRLAQKDGRNNPTAPASSWLQCSGACNILQKPHKERKVIRSMSECLMLLLLLLPVGQTLNQKYKGSNEVYTLQHLCMCVWFNRQCIGFFLQRLTAILLMTFSLSLCVCVNEIKNNWLTTTKIHSHALLLLNRYSSGFFSCLHHSLPMWTWFHSF